MSFVPVDLIEVQCGGLFYGISLGSPGGGEVEGSGITLLSSMASELSSVVSEQNEKSKQQPATPGATNEQDTRDEPQLLNLFGRPTPALGVGQSSPAALQLMTDLCRHLIDRIDEIAKSS